MTWGHASPAVAARVAATSSLCPGSAYGVAYQPHDVMISVAISPSYASDHTMFIGSDALSVTLTTHVLLKSTDGGLTWQVCPGFPNYQAGSLAIAPDYQADETICAATNGRPSTRVSRLAYRAIRSRSW